MARNFTGKSRAVERYAPKVETAEVSERNFAVRLVFAIIFLLAGSVAIAIGFKNLVSAGEGWQEIEIGTNDSVNYSNEFTLNYDLGASGTAANVENKQITEVYTQACADTYQYFTVDTPGTDFANLADLNAAPNTTLTVSEQLYDALSLLEECGSRVIYLGPIYASSENLFSAEADTIAKEYDPHFSDEYGEYYAQIAVFASDENAVSLELLGQNQVCLSVSQEYLDFAEENGIDRFVDLAWLRNAFVCDTIADTLIDAGYTNGMLTSCDGYTRYLDDDTYEYSTPIYNRTGNNYYQIATQAVSGLNASVVFTDFSADDVSAYNYYLYEDGTARTRFIGTADGMDHAALSYLFAASADHTCAEIAIAVSDYYICDTWAEDASSSLEADGIYTLYSEGDQAVSNLP